MIVNNLDIEFNGRGLGDRMEQEMLAEARDRLQLLAVEHKDLIGAAINIRQPAKSETSYLYKATVVVYVRPENIAATEKNSDPFVALRGALDAVERQVRKRRDKLREHWKQPGSGPVDQEVTEIVAAGSGDPESVHN